MSFNLLKSIRNTHRHPINITLHIVGFTTYLIGLSIIVVYFNDGNKVITGIFCIIIAIGLFLIGHKIEGNLGANTIVILLKYIKYKINENNK
jgi:hypothetical protein